MTLYLYVSTVSGNADIRAKQQQIINILEGKKIKFVQVDIAADENAKTKMRASMEAAHKSAPFVAPQLFFGDEYLGGFAEFEEAVEENRLEAFLRL